MIHHHHNNSLVEIMRANVRNMHRIVMEARRPNRETGNAPTNTIAFYCKGCERMFFATAEDAVDFQTAQKVAGYLMEGHRLEKVVAATARRNLDGCVCQPCVPAA